MESTEIIDFEMSPQTDKLFASMAKFQSELEAAPKSSENPFFKSKYSDLFAVITASKPMHHHGLCLTQFPLGEGGLMSILGHSSGQYIRARMQMKPTKKDPQGEGSALTYMRRYARASITGLGSEDDDGNAASVPKKSTPKVEKFSKDNLNHVQRLGVKLDEKNMRDKLSMVAEAMHGKPITGEYLNKVIADCGAGI